MLWSLALNQLVKTGDLTVIDANGKTHRYGVAGQTPKSTIRLHDKALHHKLLFYPELYLGEAYMDQTLTVEEGSLHDFLDLLARNLVDMKPKLAERMLQKILPVVQKIQQHNPLGKAQQNVAPHYDISDQLYSLFLDKDWHYSCAYFTDEQNSLEQAQQDKVRHIAAKLLLEPGMRILDIGSGWGGMAMYLSRLTGAHVTGVSLSGEQVAKANQRAKEEGLQDRVRFLQKDYREVTGPFDRIVSVGMMEHVGVGFYPELFSKVRELLTPDGLALFHCIGRLDGPGTTPAWLRKYIFPGGYAPALSEVTKVVEKSSLRMTDIEILRMHYALTLRAWQDRFMKHRAEAVAIYDERFCRMFEFYLVSCEMEFRYLDTMVFQMQLSKRLNDVPFTRDYMLDTERQLGDQLPKAKIA